MFYFVSRFIYVLAKLIIFTMSRRVQGELSKRTKFTLSYVASEIQFSWGSPKNSLHLDFLLAWNIFQKFVSHF